MTYDKCPQCGASAYEVAEIARLKEENSQLRLAIASHLGPSELTHRSSVDDLREACRVAMDTIWRQSIAMLDAEAVA